MTLFFHYPLTWENKNYEFKLDGIKAFLSHLNNPQSNLKIIHVGGTNGKGTRAPLFHLYYKSQDLKWALLSPH